MLSIEGVLKMILKGIYTDATVFTKSLESSALDQIIKIINQPFMKGVKVRIMPDVHAGAGICIGYTAALNSYIVPNFIGVDIGCGMTALPVGNCSVPFTELDRFIRDSIPNGSSVCQTFDEAFVEEVYAKSGNTSDLPFEEFKRTVNDISARIGTKPFRDLCSIGTLGGGNHFISIDESKDGDRFLVIHSGSRNFGKRVAEYHQNIARSAVISRDRLAEMVEAIKRSVPRQQIEEKILEMKGLVEKKTAGLEWLKDSDAENYFKDMKIAQLFARINRRVMLAKIARNFGVHYADEILIESVHNYIDFEDGIIRKGAISAKNHEKVLIPLSMADGILYGEGRGNEEWNCSAPHGAGRLMSRSKAKDTISIDEYRKRMKDAGVWSSCVGQATLDEAPQAYKNPDVIKESIGDTVTILDHWKEIYNFKAAE
jgi:RNA-splicing ligase RtcB